MLKLEDIKKDAALSGLEPGQVVRVVTTEPVGDNALTIYYKKSDGQLCEQMVFRTDEARLSLAETGRPWAFDAPTYTSESPVPQAAKKRFYGSIDLDPILAKKQFADLVDEVVLQFTSRPGVKLKIAIEIHADSATGFDDGLQRAVKENCNVLRFKNAEFEELVAIAANDGARIK